MRTVGQAKNKKILNICLKYLRGQNSNEAAIIQKDYILNLQNVAASATKYHNRLLQIQISNFLSLSWHLLMIKKFKSFFISNQVIQNQQLLMEKYVPLEQIGKGSFGVVRKVKRVTDGAILVWKEINFEKMTSREKQQLVTEVNLLKGLDHTNIVRYQDRIVDKRSTKVFIIMEYCEGGDLGSYLKQCKKTMQPISEEVIWKIAYQLLLALQYCHNRTTDEKGKGGKVLHRDIKPANIFINKSNHIKLGDFGLSRQMGQHSQFAQTHVGTPYYMSPQQVRNLNYNEKSDIWSTGCLIYELAALRRPFQANNHLALAKKIEDGKYDRIPYRFSENLFQLIKKMLVVDPDRRFSAKDLLLNPVFKIRAKEDQLKQRILQTKIRQEKLKERERELQMMKNESFALKGAQRLEQDPLMALYRKKSSRQSEKLRGSEKENKNYSNLQNS